MSVNEYEMNYENVMLYHHENLNKIKIAIDEKLNNFISKSILFYILTGKQNHDVICDYYIIGVGEADLYDLTTRTLYIFDSTKFNEFRKIINELYSDSEVEVITIDPDDLPDDIFQRYLKLREYIIPP